MQYYFTNHARQRMAERRICYTDVIYAVRYGYAARSGGGDVVYELRDLRRFPEEAIPLRLFALIQKRAKLFVAVAKGGIVKTAGWRWRGKKTGGEK